MSAKKCPVCGTGDKKLIRECQLRGMIPACAGAVRSFTAYPPRLEPKDERLVEDE